ncbi:MAG TPA: GIY-YIG nuclease family protein [Niabella sp.]|nr:GIY-YIG nuclease family protein [Chitinophagaceae bacterium]HRO85723.1 GIY-YIG nuclease family protein [Niabella sp.]
MDKDKKLQELLDNDPLGLLNIKPSNSPSRNEDERLVASFQEINEFFEQYKREPKPGNGIQEHQLHSHLKSIRANPAKSEILKAHDIHGILSSEPQEPVSIDDIIENDPLGLLDDDTAGLFELKNIKATEKSRAETDFVARRKPCKDFYKYEQQFKDVQKDLKDGKRKLIVFKLGNLRQEAYYVHNGILFFVEKIEITKKDHYKPDGTRVREDGRTRCIFENGTESNMLKRSIEKLLYANGQVVTENADQTNEDFTERFSNITAEDEEAGFIYILKSKSDKKELKEIHNLYKIGFSKTTVEDRVKNASQEPTYLMADVRIVMAYKCYNMNPQKLEQLLHNFFGTSCLNFDVFDKDGNRHTPREWFIAPLTIIEQAIHYIISGDIIYYRYDSTNEEIVER